LLQNWPRNTSNAEDDEYETLIFTYNKELDSLISTNYITRNPKEEERSPPNIEDVVTNSKEETDNTFPPFQGYVATNLEDMTLMPTP
jgi:hypothetical protein